MDHAEFRRLFGADPKRTEPAVVEHRARCAECARYAADLEKVDALVARALPVGTPENAATPPWELERRRTRIAARRYALAASVLLAIGIAFVWAATARQRDALIAEIVRHADRERSVFVVSPKRVENPKVEAALAKAGAELLFELPVSTARVCKVRGNVAPHLIVQTRDGAVHVMVLSKERFWSSHSFSELGYEGVLVPKGDHSLAIIGTDKNAVDEAAKLAERSIDWND